MKQSGEGLDRHLDPKTAEHGFDPEPPDRGGELGRQIWGRYSSSPGVIPTSVTLGVASRLSSDRLPLLSDIDRRWRSAEVFSPQGLPALPYGRSQALGKQTSPSISVAPTPGEQKPGSFVSEIPNASAGLAALRPPVPVHQATESVASQTRIGKAQAFGEAPAEKPNGTIARDLAGSILERYPSRPTGRPVQRAVPLPGSTAPGGRAGSDRADSGLVLAEQAPPTGEKTSHETGDSAVSHGEEGSLAWQADPDAQPSIGKRTAMPFVTEMGGPGAVIRKRLFSSPDRRENQPTVPLPEPEASILTQGGDLETDILKPHVESPQQQGSQPVFPRPEPGLSRDRQIARVWVPAQGPVPQRAGALLNLPLISPSGPVRSGSSMAQEGTFAPSWPSEQGQAPLPVASGLAIPRTGSMAPVQRQMGEPVIPAAPELHKTDGEGAGPVRSRVNSAVRRTMSPTDLWHARGTASRGPWEMPFVKAGGENTGKGVAGQITPIQAQSEDSGMQSSMPLQRQVTGPSPATPGTEAAGATAPQSPEEASPPAPAEPGLHGIDLERLADEVYAIIEQRLTIERESLGV